MSERRISFHIVGTHCRRGSPIAETMTDGGEGCGLAGPTQKGRNEGDLYPARVQLVKNGLPPGGRIETGIECADNQSAVIEPRGRVTGPRPRPALPPRPSLALARL